MMRTRGIAIEEMRGGPANRGAGHDLGVLIGAANNLAYTRYSFICLCVCARIDNPSMPPAHLHYPHYCNTIEQLLRNI